MADVDEFFKYSTNYTVIKDNTERFDKISFNVEAEMCIWQ